MARLNQCPLPAGTAWGGTRGEWKNMLENALGFFLDDPVEAL
jgi:hypothetical protein